MNERKRFYLKDAPDPACMPVEKMTEELLRATGSNVAINSEHGILRIPSRTLRAIQYLSPEVQVKIKSRISDAIGDANEIILIPKMIKK